MRLNCALQISTLSFCAAALAVFGSPLNEDCKWSMTAKERTAKDVMFAGFIYDLRLMAPASTLSHLQDLEIVMHSRIVDVTVTQVGGDHSCLHPRAVLYLNTDAGDSIERAIENLQSSTASDIPLLTSHDSPENTQSLVGNCELPYSKSESVFGIFLFSSDNAQLLQHIRARYSLRFLVKFVYLVQSDHHADLDAFTTSNSYAIQLLWKGQCPRGEPFCLEAPGVSWTAGRNMLYNEVLYNQRSFNLEHLYLIFFDDDAELDYAKVSDSKLKETIDSLRSTSNNPWRSFENYLLEYMPAIGFPHFSWHSRNDSLEVQSVPMFDAMITAFHSDIWKFVFPYESRWDNQSWHWSLNIHSAIANMFFPHHRIQFNTLSVKNLQHRPYPRGGPKTTATAWFAAGVRNPALIMLHKWDLYGETPPHFDHMPVYKLNATTPRYSEFIRPLDIDICHPYWRSHGFGGMMNCGDDEYDLTVATFDVTLRLLEHQKLLSHKERLRDSMKCSWNDSDYDAVQL